MIAREGTPALTRQVASLGDVFGDRRLGYRKVKLEQIT
jgi:hypothetical protein